MAIWTTETKANRYFPTADTGSLVTAVATLITQASDLVAADLAEVYWPFPNVSQTPATPEVIQDLTAMRVGLLAHAELGTNNRFGAEADSFVRLDNAYRALKKELRERSTVIPQVTISAEVLAFGTAPYDDNEHAFNPGALGLDGFEVIPETVRVSGYEYGHDFTARFNEHNRAWVFLRYTNNIANGATVTYKISYLKPREKGKAPALDSTEMILA